ncbi:hypothetical protein CLCR_01726 [Cladophialophora carrionii]|uniref:Uncharacterized protein n=1 Tax=Cladophialophora carrionii TaxID=86049 RepID=A0A1C1CBF7_9EURO|nr:hypothetical protein CLCR_01726 [Cladophialophora carrionii]
MAVENELVSPSDILVIVLDFTEPEVIQYLHHSLIRAGPIPKVLDEACKDVESVSLLYCGSWKQTYQSAVELKGSPQPPALTFLESKAKYQSEQLEVL